MVEHAAGCSVDEHLARVLGDEPARDKVFGDEPAWEEVFGDEPAREDRCHGHAVAKLGLGLRDYGGGREFGGGGGGGGRFHG